MSTYFLFSAAFTASMRKSSSSSMARLLGERLRLPMSRASLFITTSTSARLLLTRVLPLLTMSNMASLRPMPGLISTEPVITCMSALIWFSCRKRRRIFGYEVAIFLPSNQPMPVYFTALGMAKDMRHLEKPSGRIISACSWRSSYSFLPTIPRSVTPVATHCGISSSRRYNTSMGKSAL